MNRETESAFVTYTRERACSKIWVGDTLLAIPHTNPELSNAAMVALIGFLDGKKDQK